jgi:hypothetical protein
MQPQLKGMIMQFTALKFSGLAFAASLLFGATAVAQTVSSGDYQTGKARIKSEYAVEKKSCSSLAGNAKDICEAKAKGKEKVAQAELYDSYKPTLKTHYKVRVIKAEAVYEVAKQQCDDMAGNPKDVCIKEAKAALTASKADAKVQLKTSSAKATAVDKSTQANAVANKEATDVRVDASAEKRAAQYKVEKEKCDALATTAKDNCLTEAKANFGKL